MLVDSVRIQTNDSRAAGGDAAFAPDNADGLDLDSCRDVVVRDLPWNIRTQWHQACRRGRILGFAIGKKGGNSTFFF